MRETPQDLGQRIIAAARMAAVMHLHAAAEEVANFGRRMRIGGADPVPIGGADHLTGGAGLQFVTDDAAVQPAVEPMCVADEPAEPREPADAWPASGPSARTHALDVPHPSPRLGGRGGAA